MSDTQLIMTDWAAIRRCVRCGDEADSMQTHAPRHCPSCGCDFVHRPPRSYAEMEGLLGAADPILEREELLTWRHIVRSEEAAAMQRWLPIGFAIVFALIAMLLVLVTITTAS